MSTKESTPKQEKLKVKLEDLQNYNNADHAKRDAFRREFAKKAFGAKNTDLIDKQSDEVINKSLDAIFDKDGKTPLDRQQYYYNLGTGQTEDYGRNRATPAEAPVESPESASLRERAEAARRPIENAPAAPAAAPESNPAAATPEAAPADAPVQNNQESSDQTSDIEGNSLYNRAGSYLQLAKMDGASKLKRYFSVGSTRHQNKLAALTAEKAEGESQEAYDKRLAKAERNKKWGGRFRKFGAAAIAVGGFFAAKYGYDAAFGGNHENAQSAAEQAANDGDTYGPHAVDLEQAALDHHNSLLEQFNFPDPAKSTEKLLDNDFNCPIPNGNNLPAFREALDQQWRGNSQEMAYYLSQSGIEGAPVEAHFPNEAAYLQAIKDYGDFLGDPKNVQVRIDKINELNGKFDGAQYSVENITNPFESPYVDSADGLVKIDHSVEQGGTITVVRFADGTELHVRNECGQPIKQIIQQYYATPQGGGNSTPQGSGGGNYYTPTPNNPVYPEGGDNPSTPENPDTPQEPENPQEPEEPEEPTGGDDGKGNAYPGHGSLTTDLGAGEFMAEPVDVETIVDTITGRDLGGGRTEAPIIDQVINAPGIQTGGRDNAPGVTGDVLNTGGNAGAGSGIEVESGAGAGATQTGTVTSR